MPVLTTNNSILTHNGYMLHITNPYNPLDVPVGKLRFAFNRPKDIRQYSGEGIIPEQWSVIGREMIGNIEYLIMDYDYPINYHSGLNQFYSIFNTHYEDIKILGGDLTGRDPTFLMTKCTTLSTVGMVDIRNVSIRGLLLCFDGCTGLQSIAQWPTSNVTGWDRTFRDCIKLQSIPAFDMSSTISMHQSFRNCFRVENGALNIYNQVKDQVEDHGLNVFTDCGLLSTTGRAELAQIPTSWGGTMEEEEEE